MEAKTNHSCNCCTRARMRVHVWPQCRSILQGSYIPLKFTLMHNRRRTLQRQWERCTHAVSGSQEIQYICKGQHLQVAVRGVSLVNTYWDPDCLCSFQTVRLLLFCYPKRWVGCIHQNNAQILVGDILYNRVKVITRYGRGAWLITHDSVSRWSMMYFITCRSAGLFRNK